MGRGNHREEFENNNYYHIYNRGFKKNIIFKSDNDFERFYKYIIKNQKDYLDKINLISYCFLPNHFHFIFQIKETGLFLSEFMRKIQVSYAMYYKSKYEIGLREPVFEGRFKAKLIKDENYLHKCIVYVNFNALKHKITDNIDDYKWTSYHQIDKNKLYKYKDLILEELEY